MVKVKSFAVIGGDKRQLYMAKALEESGYAVFVAGFENMEQNLFSKKAMTSYIEAINSSDAVVLPLPVSKDKKTLNAPFSENTILLNDEFANLICKKLTFCGMKERLLNTSELCKENKIYDYFEREELAVFNAVPSAEGAIEIAMREYPGTINSSNCLVIGNGRIGKVLSFMLKGLGANVTVSARRKEDLAWVELSGFHVDNTKSLKDKSYNLIFNTVPFLVLDATTLAKIAKKAIVIDLASSPGGTDFESAQRLGIKAIHALSLPGKVAPKTSGEIIKNTIINILEEDSNE